MSMNPRILKIYQEEELRKEKEESYKMKISAWINGVYQISAIQTALNPKKAKYPKAPTFDSDNQDNTDEIKIDDAEGNRLIKDEQCTYGDLMFINYINAFNRKFEDKNRKVGEPCQQAK